MNIKKLTKRVMACLAATMMLLSTAVSSYAVPVKANTDALKNEENNAEVTMNEMDTAQNEENAAEEVAAMDAAEESSALYSGADLQFQGVIQYDGHRFTWYSERVLPGGGLNIPGRHADESGYICDEDDFICVASRDYAKGTEVDTPFGKKGKVYDWCAISGTIDIYVNW